MFQGSVANGATVVSAIPNGTNQSTQLVAINNSDPTNAQLGQLFINASEVRLASAAYGTGTSGYLPLTMYTGGSERLRIDTSGNVGIGTSSPAAKLDVSNSNGRNARIGGIQIAGTSATADAGNNFVGSGAFWNGTNFTATATSAASIQLGNGVFNFYNDTGLTAGNTFSLSSKMTIDSSGNVGIGTASPANKLAVVGGNAGNMLVDNGGQQYTQLLLQRNSTANTGGDILIDGTNSIMYLRSLLAGRISIGTSASAGSPVERLSINTTGTLSLQGAATNTTGVGITFPATQSASSDANTLDDYEEGTFTPIVSAGITSPTYARQAGRYTKIGNLVQIQVSIETNGGTRNGATLVIGSLPFTIGTFTGGPGFTIAYVSNVVNSTTTNLPTVYGDVGTVNLSCYKSDSSIFAGNDLQSASFRIDFSGTYGV
jgi:hypothetical protein